MKNREKILLLVCLVCSVFFGTLACTGQKEVNPEEDFVYCLNSEETGLVKVPCELAKDSPKKAAESALKGMSEPSENIEYLPSIPEGVELNNLKVERAIAYVDFSGAYLDIPSIREKLVRAAVVQSLVRLEGISGVVISVNEETLKNESGNSFGVLNEDDFVQNTGSSPSSYEKTTLTLFFANETGDGLVRQQMDVKYNSNISKEKLIVEKLMQGPRKSGAFPTVNPAATLLSVTIKEGICYVNFDAEFLNSVYDVRPEITIYSIVDSVIEGTSAETVQITVNGEKDVVYQETVDLSQPMLRDLDWEETQEEQKPAEEEKES